MKQKVFQIDAFTDKVFSGNPAAVCILDHWLDEWLMQRIAMENNLAETAFVVRDGTRYQIRWFTPETEVDLCGHATLASAYVLFQYFDINSDTIEFYSPGSGKLSVEKGPDGYLTMDFPRDETIEIEGSREMVDAIGAVPVQSIKGKTDYLLIYSTQAEIEAMTPNFHLLNHIDCRGVIVSAPGDEVDFVSRFFAPQSGIPEDPVTGSAHTTLTPYWAKTLGKTKLTARQLSARGGDLLCEDMGKRIKISGKAVPYLIGEIDL